MVVVIGVRPENCGRVESVKGALEICCGTTAKGVRVGAARCWLRE